MRAYVMTTGAVFGLITLAHVLRIFAEGRHVATDPWFLLLTVATAMLSLLGVAPASTNAAPVTSERNSGNRAWRGPCAFPKDQAMARPSDRSRPSAPARRSSLTDRVRSIAGIQPLQDEDGLEAALRAMAAEGLIRRAARRGPMPAPRWRPVKVKGTPVSQTIIDDREDRT